jgi:hypothetical protein
MSLFCSALLLDWSLGMIRDGHKMRISYKIHFDHYYFYLPLHVLVDVIIRELA